MLDNGKQFTMLKMTGWLLLLLAAGSSSADSLLRDQLFRFSVEWQQPVTSENIDLERAGDDSLDARDLIALLQAWEYGIEFPTATPRWSFTATVTPTITPSPTPVYSAQLLAAKFLDEDDSDWPSVAAKSNGDYSITYIRLDRVRFQEFDEQGSPLRDEDENELSLPQSGGDQPDIDSDSDDYVRIGYELGSSSRFFTQRRDQSVVYSMPDGTRNPAVAIDDDGFATVVFEIDNQVYFILFNDSGDPDVDLAFALSDARNDDLENPDVAVNEDGDFLAVWARSDRVIRAHELFSNRDIPDNYSDEDVIAVSVDRSSRKRRPRVEALLDDYYLVVWEDERSNPEGEVYAQLVDRTGDPVWAADLRIDDSIVSAKLPSVTAIRGREQFLVAWLDGRGPEGSVRARVVDAEGLVTVSSFALVEAERSLERVDIAASVELPGDFAAAWQEKDRVYGSLFRLPE